MSRLSVRRRLRTWLMLMALLAVAPSMCLTVVHGFRNLERARTIAKEDALRLAAQVSNTQDNIVDAARQLLVALAVTVPVQTRNPVACGQLFESLVKRLGNVYLNIVAIDPDGRAFAQAQADAPLPSYGDREWFQETLRTQSFTTSGFLIGRSTGLPTMAMGYPVMNPDGTVRTVLALGISLNWIGARLARFHLPPDSVVAVVDRQGVVLAREPALADLIGKPVGDVPLIKEILTREQGETDAASLDGKRRLIGFMPLYQNLPSSPYVYVGIPSEVAYGPARRGLGSHLFWLTLVGLVGMALAWGLGNHFLARPLRTLSDAARDIGTGQYDVRVKDGFVIDELNALGSAFNHMAEDLESHERNLARKAEKLTRSNRDLEHFAYVASHDLQEPLRKVTSFAELLAKRYGGQLDETATRYIDYMVDGARRMSALINHLLAFSRLNTTGREFASVDCDALLKTVLADLNEAIAEAGAVITRDPLPTVHGDAIQLGQVLQNIVANAVKFRGQEPPMVHITAARRDAAWEFSIQDNGIGIAPEQAERVFRMFQRLHTPGEYPGAGIGLAMCKRIVERHGGRIWIDSLPGQGATFHFTLPDDEGETA